MGDLTRQQMRDEVRLALGQRSSDELGGEQIDTWINWAYQHVSRPTIHRHREMKAVATTTLAQGDDDYGMSSDFGISDFLAVIDVADTTDAIRYHPMTVHEKDEIDSTIEGRARFYTLYYDTGTDETVLLLDREPGSQDAGNTLQLRYWRQPPVFSSTTSKTVLLPDWDEVIVQGAIWRGWRALGEVERAEVAKAEFGQLVNEVSERMRLDAEDEGARILTMDLFEYQERV